MASYVLVLLARSIKYYCMMLKETRNKYGLTQKEAALLIGIPYRTYVRYEENDSFSNSYKYKKMIEDLDKLLTIDEDHDVLKLADIKSKLIPILEKHDISFCYLFGSYARGDAVPTSDIDILIDTNMTGFEYLSLVEEIRTALSKRIDLLRLCDLKSDNPIIVEILKEGVRIL